MARDFRAQSKDYRMKEVTNISISLKVAIIILIAKTNSQISRANAITITMARGLALNKKVLRNTKGGYGMLYDAMGC